MKTTHEKHFRVLGLSPSTKGFGFALLEGQDKLVDWGVKSITGDRNNGSRAKIEEMIAHYQPEVIVLENPFANDSRRTARIRALYTRIVALAESHQVTVKSFSRKQVRRTFFEDGCGTKHALAEILAARFPQELGFRLPPKRRPWMSEDLRMDIFDAVALVMAFRRKRK